ncbi:alpha/beta fold hydrolase [Pseudothauera nasutitermitis]|uniref:Alpha/beta fold hydrolase n=1 Tax=Pseudothauera nasutitermitis TaxID=2565930 RepID=A0A4V3WB97_9RHOO|nr:alpha/beta fold hydrolase [Pseudothauera nasutitermitis]THF62367.1 alpha/beta fold hydrolase [Pseudothauera nasutitermitis]
MTADTLSVRLVAADGYALGATRYPARAPLKGRVVVAGATAVPQGFYKRFALFVGDRGFETLTLDYRGIGLSRPPSLKGFRMDFLDWARLDLAAAVDAMADDAVPLYVVGHSYGGHAFGLLPNHRKVAGCCIFGTGAGWHGYMPPGERLRVLAMWKVVLPVLTWWKGYCPWRMLGLGEDLPVDVYRQWRHWCQFPHYFFDDPAMRGIEQDYAAVHTPIVAVNALDDAWATPTSRDAFIQAYRNAPLTRKDLDPAQIGGEVGHMGYFRQTAEPLWGDMLEWFADLPRAARPMNGP